MSCIGGMSSNKGKVLFFGLCDNIQLKGCPVRVGRAWNEVGEQANWKGVCPVLGLCPVIKVRWDGRLVLPSLGIVCRGYLLQGHVQ